MREPYIEGLATHDDPESCIDVREDGGEALTGARMGRVSSREIRGFGTPTLLSEAEGNTCDTDSARCRTVPRGRRPLARAEPFCTRTGRSSERPPKYGVAGRIGKAEAAIR